MKTSEYYILLSILFIQNSGVMFSLEKNIVGTTSMYLGLFYLICAWVSRDEKK